VAIRVVRPGFDRDLGDPEVPEGGTIEPEEIRSA
jgi:hypothetical protein